MPRKDFKVYFNRIYNYTTLFAGIICAVGLIALDPRKIVVEIAFVMGILFLYGFIRWRLFCVTVTDTSIYVRTEHGKKYSFLCSEIDKIAFIKRNGCGPDYFLSIAANNKELCLRDDMDGFKTMIAYLLEQRSAGTIKKSAINEKTGSSLHRYINGEIFGIKKEEINQARTLSDFSTMANIQTLLVNAGFFCENNCCFVSYENAQAKYLPANALTDDPYNGYLINKTEKGFGMIPLIYKKCTTIKPSTVAVLEKHSFFVPNEKIKCVTIRPYRKKIGARTVGIILDFEDRTLYLLSKIDEPLLSYHNKNLAEFINTYTS